MKICLKWGGLRLKVPSMNIVSEPNNRSSWLSLVNNRSRSRRIGVSSVSRNRFPPIVDLYWSGRVNRHDCGLNGRFRRRAFAIPWSENSFTEPARTTSKNTSNLLIRWKDSCGRCAHRYLRHFLVINHPHWHHFIDCPLFDLFAKLLHLDQLGIWCMIVKIGSAAQVRIVQCCVDISSTGTNSAHPVLLACCLLVALLKMLVHYQKRISFVRCYERQCNWVGAGRIHLARHCTPCFDSVEE